MKAPQYERSPGVASRPGGPNRSPSQVGNHRRWVRLSKLDRQVIRDLAAKHSAGQERMLFAISYALKPSPAGPEQARRVLVFDTHPDTLRLVFGGNANRMVEDRPSQARDAFHLALTTLLLLLLATAMFWPLITR